MKLLLNPWLGSILGAVFYFATLTFAWLKALPAQTGEAHSDTHVESIPAGPSWTFQNPEIDALVKELREEKQTLAARKTELDELAARLNAERAELLQSTQKVHQLQVNFDQSITRIQLEESTNLARMAKTYVAMAPENVVKIFKELDDQIVVKTLRFMKEKETAPILEQMARLGEADARRAALIAEKLRLTVNPPPAKTKK